MERTDIIHPVYPSEHGKRFVRLIPNDAFCLYINPEMENKLTSHGFLTQRRNYSYKQKRDNLFSRTPEGSHCALLSTHYTYAVNRLAAICGRVPPISSLNHSGLARSSDDGRMQGDRQQAQVEIRKDGVY